LVDSIEDSNAKLKKIYEEFPSILKRMGAIGSLFGFIYLFSYTRYAGIPFPLELSVLPSAMLLIGTVALLVTMIIFGAVLYPMFLSSESSLITNVVLLAKDVEVNKRARTGYFRYFVCYWIPMALTLVGLLLAGKILDYGITGTYFSIGFFVAAPCLILFMARRLPIQRGQYIEYVVTAAGQIIISVFANFMGVLIAIALIPEFGDWDVKAGFLIVLIGFTLIHFLLSMPNYHIEKYQILMPPYFESKTAPKQVLTIVILLFFVFLSVLIYPVNAKIGKAVLVKFGIGGEIPISICLKEAPPAAITQRISFGTDKCSESLALLLDAGDRIYVTKPTPNDQGMAKASLASPPIYFRQDQVLQKVYLLPSKAEKGSKS
jgi:hypothetical protein